MYFLFLLIPNSMVVKMKNWNCSKTARNGIINYTQNNSKNLLNEGYSNQPEVPLLFSHLQDFIICIMLKNTSEKN